MCSLGSGKHRTPYGDWVIHVPGLGLREHSKPLLGARRKRVLRIAISSGRRRWPVPPVGPPLPRSGPAYTAARSSTRCRSRPGELKTVSRPGPICLLGGGGLGGIWRHWPPTAQIRYPLVPGAMGALWGTLFSPAESNLEKHIPGLFGGIAERTPRSAPSQAHGT